jgi:hypothetical protein
MLLPDREFVRMQHYRVYVIGEDGHFIKSIDLSCDDDNAAIEATKPLIDGHGLELWQRDRRIARFDMRPKDTNGWFKGELKPPE